MRAESLKKKKGQASRGFGRPIHRERKKSDCNWIRSFIRRKAAKREATGSDPERDSRGKCVGIREGIVTISR